MPRKIPPPLLLAALVAAAFARAAAREEGPRQVAVFSLPSLGAATAAFSAGLAGIGESAAEGSAEAALAWLFPAPSLDCADLGRPATAYLLTPEFDRDLPDRAAALPLDPVGGAFRLRASLAGAYGKITGTNVLFCSEAADSNRFPDVCLAVTNSTALIATSRRSLRWIARRYRDGAPPSAVPVRAPAAISLAFDGPLACGVLRAMLPEDASPKGLPGLLALFRDVLGSVQSLDVSLAPDIRSWRIACRLNYADGALGPSAAPPSPAGAFPGFFPPLSFCRSVSALPLLTARLPRSFRAHCGEAAADNFCGLAILPGMPEADARLFPHLTGVRAAACVIAPLDGRLGKIAAFKVRDAAAVEKALAALAAGQGAAAGRPRLRATRKAGGVQVYGYETTAAATDIRDKGDFAAQTLTIVFKLGQVEVALRDGALLVASGARGLLDSWLEEGRFVPPRLADDFFAAPLGPLPAGEAPLGGGELEPSATLQAAAEALPGLRDISRQLPHSGGGFRWRLSRCETGLVFDLSAANSEILAVKALRRLDAQALGKLVLGYALESVGGE